MMNKVRNHQVPEFWQDNQAASNHGGTFWTDGKKLYSYSLLIGDTCEKSGTKVLRDYSANGKWGYKSQTTSCHIGRARCYADILD